MCREVIGVRVGVDQVTDAQAVARGEAQIAVDLADLRIDQRGRAGVGAAEEIRLAAAASNCS